jgi:transcriptional regulator with XRE-family HTH domain
MAGRLGVTQSRISKIELAAYTPTPALLERIADALQLPEDTRSEILDHAAELSVEVHMVRAQHRRGGGRSIQAQVGEREAAAAEVWTYQAAAVPGLLQTPDYTREMVPLILPSIPDVDELVAGRAERQRVLYDRGKSFRFLIAEGALRARVAPTAVMRGQLDRLVYLAAALPNVEIRALPFGVRLAAWAMTSFDVVGDRAEVELQAGEILVSDPREVATYRATFEALWRLALGGDELVAFIRDIDAWLTGLTESAQ